MDRVGHVFLLEVIVPNWFETSAGHQFAPDLNVLSVSDRGVMPIGRRWGREWG